MLVKYNLFFKGCPQNCVQPFYFRKAWFIMSNIKKFAVNASITIFILLSFFILNLFLQKYFSTQSLIPMIFVLGVFLVSLKTSGYLWGIAASLISVIALNFAFTYPYYAFGFLVPESITSAVVMFTVAIITCTLTSKIKAQERIRLESEKEKMRANLLRAISHDLRTPLTSIYGATSTVIENYDSLTKEQHIKLLEDVLSDSEWLIRMVENLLSVTRIDGKKVQVSKTSTVLEELIDSSLLKFQKHYPEQKIKLSIPEQFISIGADALLIEQVLINLLENAVLHAKGMTELSLNVKVEGTQAIFEISDNGCGIPKDRINNIFTGYWERNDAPSDGSKKNMGIGLSVCSAIIKAHGGSIEARNKKEGGAIFCFSLEIENIEMEAE